jgi:hypothetical protein
MTESNGIPHAEVKRRFIFEPYLSEVYLSLNRNFLFGLPGPSLNQTAILRSCELHSSLSEAIFAPARRSCRHLEFLRQHQPPPKPHLVGPEPDGNWA